MNGSIMWRVKYFSALQDILWNQSEVKNWDCPKFVKDYVQRVQPILNTRNRVLCEDCFPVAPIGENPENGKYFWDCVGDVIDLPLVYKDGRWFEEKGIFFNKKLIPVTDPAQWMVDYVISEADPDDPDNQENSDYPEFMKALSELKKMVGKYKSNGGGESDLKHFSISSDTIDWAKKFTPRIKIGNNSRVWFLWPGTLVGAAVGFIKGLASKIKHKITGKPTDEHTGEKPHSTTKQFSDTPLGLDVKGYCKEIPGYEQLCVLHTLNLNLLDKVSPDNRKFIFENFPSFLVVSSPETITAYRKDFIDQYNQDYAEIMFAYGNEINLLWDFDKKGWYLKDNTYNPSKEWKVTDNNILRTIRSLFDPSKNPLLEMRLKKWEGDEKLKDKFNMRKYCQIILTLIDTVNKA